MLVLQTAVAATCVCRVKADDHGCTLAGYSCSAREYCSAASSSGAEVNATSVCLCNSYFGFAGDECERLTPVSYLNATAIIASEGEICEYQ